MPISLFATKIIDDFLKLIPQRLFAYTCGEMTGLRAEWTSKTKGILQQMAVARELKRLMGARAGA